MRHIIRLSVFGHWSLDAFFKKYMLLNRNLNFLHSPYFLDGYTQNKNWQILPIFQPVKGIDLALT
jgi:hypothetical protein